MQDSKKETNVPEVVDTTVLSKWQKLLKIQGEVPTLKKDNKAKIQGQSKKGQSFEYSYNYNDINSILKAVKPILTKYGVVLIQPVKIENDKLTVSSILIDADTGEEISESSITNPNIHDPKELGSAITYFRRYTIQPLLALNAEDNEEHLPNRKNSQQYNQQEAPKLPTQEAPKVATEEQKAKIISIIKEGILLSDQDLSEFELEDKVRDRLKQFSLNFDVLTFTKAEEVIATLDRKLKDSIMIRQQKLAVQNSQAIPEEGETIITQETLPAAEESPNPEMTFTERNKITVAIKTLKQEIARDEQQWQAGEEHPTETKQFAEGQRKLAESIQQKKQTLAELEASLPSKK